MILIKVLSPFLLALAAVGLLALIRWGEEWK